MFIDAEHRGKVNRDKLKEYLFDSKNKKGSLCINKSQRIDAEIWWQENTYEGQQVDIQTC